MPLFHIPIPGIKVSRSLAEQQMSLFHGFTDPDYFKHPYFYIHFGRLEIGEEFSYGPVYAFIKTAVNLAARKAGSSGPIHRFDYSTIVRTCNATLAFKATDRAIKGLLDAR